MIITSDRTQWRPLASTWPTSINSGGCIVHSRVADLRRKGYAIECLRFGHKDYRYKADVVTWPTSVRRISKFSCVVGLGCARGRRPRLPRGGEQLRRRSSRTSGEPVGLRIGDQGSPGRIGRLLKPQRHDAISTYRRKPGERSWRVPCSSAAGVLSSTTCSILSAACLRFASSSA
jgi:hypothetical protein